jgi:hypothetical protein
VSDQFLGEVKIRLEQELFMSFGFKNIGHFFATVAGDIVKGARVVGSVMQQAQKAEPEIEAISSLFFPQAVELERGAFALLGIAAQAVKETGDAAAANGINIVLDQQLITDIKLLIGAIEQYSKTAGLTKPAGK